MDDTLKRNIRKTMILMLAAAFVLWLWLPMELIRYLDRSSDTYWIVMLALVELAYILCCLFVLVWGSSRVIWKLPLRKNWRTVIFFAWLIVYPACCWLWLFFCMLCCYILGVSSGAVHPR